MLPTISKFTKLAARLPVFAVAHAATLVAGLKARAEGRSSKWPAFAKAWLKAHPYCANCGSKKNVVPHHKVPFHIDATRELDETNLITLCENKTLNCHLWQGHNGNFQSINPTVVADSTAFLIRLSNRPIIPFSPER